jgi:hypothetical protein
MAERISRPPVRIKSALPDGHNNGLTTVAKHFLTHTDARYGIVELERRELVHNDAANADVAVLGIARIAVAPDPESEGDLLSLLTQWLDEVRGQTALPFEEEPTPAKRARYEDAVTAWQKREGLSPADVQDRWQEYFKGAPVPGPIGSELQPLIEFVLEVCGEPT